MKRVRMLSYVKLLFSLAFNQSIISVFKNKNYLSKKDFQDLKSISSNGRTSKPIKKESLPLVPRVNIKSQKMVRTVSSTLSFRSDLKKKNRKTNFIYDSNILFDSPYYGLMKSNFKLEEKIEIKPNILLPRRFKLTNTNTCDDLKDIYR